MSQIDSPQRGPYPVRDPRSFSGIVEATLLITASTIATLRGCSRRRSKGVRNFSAPHPGAWFFPEQTEPLTT